MSTYIIYLLNSSKSVIGVLDSWTDFEFTLRTNEAGPFVLGVDWNNPKRSLLQSAKYINVERDLNLIYTGVKWEEYEREKSLDSNKITYYGLSETCVLDDRKVLPVPGSQTYGSAAEDVKTDKLETILKYYVNVNAGPGVRTNPISRQCVTTIDTDQTRGTIYTAKGRFNPLRKFLLDLINIDGNNYWFEVKGGTFYVNAVTDKTATVIFSEEMGTLQGFKLARKRATANYSIVGGTSTGTSRVFYESMNMPSVIDDGLIETFTDRRGTSTTADLAMAALADLSKGVGKMSWSITPIDTLAIKLYRDYWIGTKVTAILDGVTYTTIIKEIKINLTSGTEVVTISIGDEIYGNVVSSIDDDSEILSQRLDRLETV